MGFNSAFKGLRWQVVIPTLRQLLHSRSYAWYSLLLDA